MPQNLSKAVVSFEKPYENRNFFLQNRQGPEDSEVFISMAIPIQHQHFSKPKIRKTAQSSHTWSIGMFQPLKFAFKFTIFETDFIILIYLRENMIVKGEIYLK